MESDAEMSHDMHADGGVAGGAVEVSLAGAPSLGSHINDHEASFALGVGDVNRCAVAVLARGPSSPLSRKRNSGTLFRRMLAEGAGFEPAIRVTVCTLSKRVP